MARIYKTATGRWAVDVTIKKRRHRRVIGTKEEAQQALEDMIELQKILKEHHQERGFPALLRNITT